MRVLGKKAIFGLENIPKICWYLQFLPYFSPYNSMLPKRLGITNLRFPKLRSNPFPNDSTKQMLYHTPPKERIKISQKRNLATCSRTLSDSSPLSGPQYFNLNPEDHEL